MFLKSFHKEIELYRRREQLIEILDDFARNAFYDEDFSMKEDDPKMIILRKQFDDVLNPCDIEKALKEIYTDKTYSPKNKL